MIDKEDIEWLIGLLVQIVIGCLAIRKPRRPRNRANRRKSKR